ncbi:hypothetical protein ACFSY7_03495 [Kurthia populi]|uniref:Uncharacterized protein n=1 Tax=Kurthia populi TaxID=1562132 RepID=A0ABW5XX75_9BACL
MKPESVDYADEITCPYCQYVDDESWQMTEEEYDDFECANCGKLFDVVRHLTIRYSSKPKDVEGVDENGDNYSYAAD